MHQEEIQYAAGGANCHGTVCYDTSVPGKKPAILIVHSFTGKTDEYIKDAQEMAKKGYVAIAVDMYGDCQTGTDFDSSYALMEPLAENRPLCRRRLLDTYEWAKSLDCVDADNIAIMGYCFGGRCALDLARANAPIKAAISIHGSFDKPELDCAVQSKVLVLHGYDDPLSPVSDLPGFAAEMDSYGADWQAHFYSGTKHAFTTDNKIAPPDVAGYNETSCKRARQSTLNLLSEVFRS